MHQAQTPADRQLLLDRAGKLWDQFVKAERILFDTGFSGWSAPENGRVWQSVSASRGPRLMKLIKFLDIPGHDETLQIIRVQNSSAQEIANLLDKILRGQGNARFRNSPGQSNSINVTKLIAEPRTNSIIAMAKRWSLFTAMPSARRKARRLGASVSES